MVHVAVLKRGRRKGPSTVWAPDGMAAPFCSSRISGTTTMTLNIAAPPPPPRALSRLGRNASCRPPPHRLALVARVWPHAASGADRAAVGAADRGTHPSAPRKFRRESGRAPPLRVPAPRVGHQNSRETP